MKKPLLAAALNIIPGLGYLYLNSKRLFAWLVFAAIALGIASTFDNSPAANAYNNAPSTMYDNFAFVSILLLWAAFIIDGYREAKRMNGNTPAPVQKVASNNSKKEVKAKEQVVAMTPALRRKGLAAALVVIPLGVIAWDILWNFGFIASIVTYGIARVALRIYQRVTGNKPDASAAKPLLVIIVVGAVLSFLSGMAMDAQLSYSQHYHISTLSAYTSLDFWNFYFGSITDPSVLSSYGFDLLVAAGFAVWGCLDIVQGLMRTSKQVELNPTDKSNTATAKQ